MEADCIDGKKVLLTQAPTDIASSNDVLKKNLEITLDVMNNCIDEIYDLVKASYLNLVSRADEH